MFQLGTYRKNGDVVALGALLLNKLHEIYK
jgi:hypothetical protein